MENKSLFLPSLKGAKTNTKRVEFSAWAMVNEYSNKPSDGWYLLSIYCVPDCAHGLRTSSINYSPQLFKVADIYSDLTDEEMANLRLKPKSVWR